MAGPIAAWFLHFALIPLGKDALVVETRVGALMATALHMVNAACLCMRFKKSLNAQSIWWLLGQRRASAWGDRDRRVAVKALLKRTGCDTARQ
eukprot:360870-Chlamydomonas_euryale.AAC.23